MSVPTAPDDVLVLVRQLATRRRILLDWPPGRRGDHVALRMQQRRVRAGDVESALRAAIDCVPGDPGEGGRARWKVTGPDLDEEALSIVIELDGASFVIVITIF